MFEWARSFVVSTGKNSEEDSHEFDATDDSTRSRILSPKAAFVDEVGAARQSFINHIAIAVLDHALMAGRGRAHPPDGVEVDIFGRDERAARGIDDPGVVIKIIGHDEISLRIKLNREFTRTVH